MSAMASQINGVTIDYSTVCLGAYQGKHQSSASLAFVRGIHRWPMISPHKGPVTRKMFPFDYVNKPESWRTFRDVTSHPLRLQHEGWLETRRNFSRVRFEVTFRLNNWIIFDETWCQTKVHQQEIAVRGCNISSLTHRGLPCGPYGLRSHPHRGCGHVVRGRRQVPPTDRTGWWCHNRSGCPRGGRTGRCHGQHGGPQRVWGPRLGPDIDNNDLQV